MKKLLLLITASLLNGGAWAECELQYKTPADVAECYIKESEAQVETKFNELKKLTNNRTIYNKSATADLLESQKNWLRYRGSYCKTYSNYHGEINNQANCTITLNKQRVEQLQNDIDAN